MVKALGTKTISKNTKLNLTNTSCNIHMKNIGSKTKESIIQYFGPKDQVKGTNATSLSSAYCSSNFSLFLIGILLTGVVMYYLSLQNPRLETRSRFKGKFGNRIYGCQNRPIRLISSSCLSETSLQKIAFSKLKQYTSNGKQGFIYVMTLIT
jgi:hypothetical protein